MVTVIQTYIQFLINQRSDYLAQAVQNKFVKKHARITFKWRHKKGGGIDKFNESKA